MAPLPALATTAAEPQPDLVDVAIALLRVSRGRTAAQTTTLIDASMLLLGSLRDDAPAIPAAVKERKARVARAPKQSKKSRRGGYRPRRAKSSEAPEAASDSRAAVSHEDGRERPGVAGNGTGGGTTVANGVTINLTPGAEEIEFRGKSIEVKARQAQLFAALAPAMPQPVDRSFIAKKLWAGRAQPAFTDTIISALMRECASAAASVGLSFKTVSGVGIALQPAESDHA